MDLIIDTREKQPWDFSIYDEINIINQGLKFGDYTIAGLEDVFRIERKRSTGELSTNLGYKKKQFLAELDLLKEVKHPYLILEFSQEDIDSFPVNSTIPRNMWSKLRLSPNYMNSMINKIREDYKINVIFAINRDNAERLVYTLITDIYNAYKKEI